MAYTMALRKVFLTRIEVKDCTGLHKIEAAKVLPRHNVASKFRGVTFFRLLGM